MIAPSLDAPFYDLFFVTRAPRCRRVQEMISRYRCARNFTFNMKDAEEGEQREPRASQTYGTFCKQQYGLWLRMIIMR